MNIAEENWKLHISGEANQYTIMDGTKNWLIALKHNGEDYPEVQLERMKRIEAVPEMLDALISVNNYFIKLQNSCALTSKDEHVWAKVSKALNK